MLEVRILPALLEDEEHIDTSTWGDIDIKASSRPFVAVEDAKWKFYLFDWIGQLIDGLLEFLPNQRQKSYSVSGLHGAHIKMDRRKHDMLLVAYEETELGLFPANEVRSAFIIAFKTFCAEYEGRFVAEPWPEVLEGFNATIKRVEELGAISGGKTTMV